MRVISVDLPSFKNLRNFQISFDQSASVSVLVGRNGAGKSNLLEALTVIFRDLDLGTPPSFPYRLVYEVRGYIVEVVSAYETSGELRVSATVDGKVVPTTKFVGAAGAEFRPSHVFGYYSGPSNRLEEHFATHQEKFYRDLVGGIERPLRPLFYARNVHSNFVLLAFFLDDDPAVERLLTDHLGIEGLDSVLFVMRQPSWKSRSGDSRFWNARGTVSRLLDRLYSLSLAPLRLERRVSIGLARSARLEQLYLYLPGIEQVRQLARGYENNREFFKALESTYISELIHDVRIRVRAGRSTSTLTFRELSEGEQQLLLVLGLMRFTQENESLFLLDEPDTHLNPSWSVQYRSFLKDFGALDDASHVLMATHDPLVVAGLLRSEVRIFDRASSGEIVASEPLDDPRGMGVGNLLTSDIYGLRSQLDLETLGDLDKKRKLAAKNHLTPLEADELRQLSLRLEDLGLLMEDRDPEFQEYLLAKNRAESENAREVSYSREEVEEKRQVALDLVREILRERGEGEGGS